MKWDTTKPPFDDYPWVIKSSRCEIAETFDGNKVVLRFIDPTVMGYRAPFNGYVTFRADEIPDAWVQEGYDAPGLQMLNVHGGLTYAEWIDVDTKDGVVRYMTFGFDCAHAGDDRNPMLKDLNHVKTLTVQMEDQLIVFASRWDEFLEVCAHLRFFRDLREWCRGDETRIAALCAHCDRAEADHD